MQEEIKRILDLDASERNEADRDYLQKHLDDMSNEQRQQIIDEMNAKDLEKKDLEEKAEEKEEEVVEVEKKEVRSQVLVEVKDLGEGTIEAVVASEAEDRHGEVIEMKGLDIKKYMKNPVVAWSHNYDEPPIAKAEKLTKTPDGKLIARMKFATNIYDKARVVYNLYKDGFLNAFSIGFIPLEIDGNRYTKSEMIEFSAVLVPANPEALLLAKQKGIDTDMLTGYNNKEMIKDEPKAEEVVEPQETPVEEPKTPTEEPAQPSEETKGLAEKLDKLTETVEKLADPVKVKNISKQFNVKNADGEVSKEMKFLLYVRGVKSGDYSEYINAVGKSAMNTSDDGILLPPAEFIAEVERLEGEYGVARRFATVRRINTGNAIRYLLGDDDVQIFDTAEGGKKKSSKLSYQDETLILRKFAGITPITDELTEDAAIDLWGDASRRYARAFAKREDQLVFTEEAAGGNTKDGVLNVAGTTKVYAGGSTFADIDADEIIDMQFSVPEASARNGRYWVSRGFLGAVSKLKGSDGRPLWQASLADGSPATLAGKPYEVVDVLPGVADEEADLAVAAFGDLRYVTLAEKSGVQIKIFDTGSVGDPDDGDQDNASDLNLLTQDMQAMRAVKRMNAVVRFPEAFSVLVLGTES